MADWGDVPTWLTSIVAIPALLFTAFQLRSATNQNALAARQTKITAQQQEDAVRPVVIAQIEESQGNWEYLDFCVRNYGAGPAYHVKVTFDEYPELSKEMIGHEFWKAKFLSQEIPVLAPGQTIHTFADAASLREEQKPLAGTGSGTLEYFSKTDEKYSEKFHIDIDLLRGTSRIVREGVHDISKTLKDIKKDMK